MKVKLIIAVIILMAIPGSMVFACDEGEEKWEWAWVDYTELDFRAMDYLWGNWIIQDGGTIAILPVSDYSTDTILEDPLGGPMSGMSRRMAGELAHEFSRIGLMPLPYDDCIGVTDRIIGMREDARMDLPGTDKNNYLHMLNKSEAMKAAVREFDTSAMSGKGFRSSSFLTRDELRMIGEMLGADLILRSSIGVYGLEEQINDNWRTFLPPFLGLFNPDVSGMVGITVYMYDAHTGELIWFAHEYYAKTPDFPLFYSEWEIMTKAEMETARRVVSHLVPPPPPEEKPCGGCGGSEEEVYNTCPNG